MNLDIIRNIEMYLHPALSQLSKEMHCYIHFIVIKLAISIEVVCAIKVIHMLGHS